MRRGISHTFCISFGIQDTFTVNGVQSQKDNHHGNKDHYKVCKHAYVLKEGYLEFLSLLTLV